MSEEQQLRTVQHSTEDAKVDRGNDAAGVDRSFVRTNKAQESALVIFSLVILVLNIFLMSMASLPEKMQVVLPNGDKVRECGEYCFEVVDYHGTPVYRSERHVRSLALRPCLAGGSSCKGEYLFSHDGEVFWSQQLHEVNGTRSLIVSATTVEGKPISQAFKMRYMLQPPYNWIVSQADVPADSHPEEAIFVDNR